MYEDELIYYTTLLFVGLICGIVCAFLANSKGRNVIGWLFIGLFFGIFGLILILCLPNLNDSASEKAIQETVNLRVQEQLRQERLKNQAFQNHASFRLDHTSARLDYHDNELGVETQSLAPSPLRIESHSGYNSSSSPPPLTSFQNQGEHHWYYAKEGRTFGPVNREQLTLFIKDGIINSQTLVYNDSYENWIPAGESIELKKYFEFYS